MVVGRAVPETQGPYDGTEVVPRESREMIVDPLAGRMLKATDRSVSRHENHPGIGVITLRTSPLDRTRRSP